MAECRELTSLCFSEETSCGPKDLLPRSERKSNLDHAAKRRRAIGKRITVDDFAPEKIVAWFDCRERRDRSLPDCDLSSSLLTLRPYPSLIGKAEVLAVSDDDVVQNSYPHKFPD